MKESVRSGGIVKKKSSLGCLIMKKKGDGLVVWLGLHNRKLQKPLLGKSNKAKDSGGEKSDMKIHKNSAW